jgi:hypothetical protein
MKRGEKTWCLMMERNKTLFINQQKINDKIKKKIGSACVREMIVINLP